MVESEESREVPCQTEIPTSPAHFSFQFESQNFPLVLKDCVSCWPACVKWDPSNGGLSYLKNLAGDARVQAMITRSGSNFYGNIREHERAVMSFGKFMNMTDSYFEESKESHSRTLKDVSKEGDPCRESVKLCVSKSVEEDARTSINVESNLQEKNQFYLAQVPIWVQQQKEELPLGLLFDDIFVPKFLKAEGISNINLWMSCGGSRSSTHYDPYHNLLCVVSGRKKVTLWPPSATHMLYPMPLFSEASNHSSVDFACPNLEVFPCFSDAPKRSWTTVLESGDALFLPEGWYHQVDSEGITLAVNIWWPSSVSKQLDSHMGAYYLRRVLASLMDAEKEMMLGKEVPCNMLKGNSEKDKEDNYAGDVGKGYKQKNLCCLREAEKQQKLSHEDTFLELHTMSKHTCSNKNRRTQRDPTVNIYPCTESQEKFKELQGSKSARLGRKRKICKTCEVVANCSNEASLCSKQKLESCTHEENRGIYSSQSAIFSQEEVDRMHRRDETCPSRNGEHFMPTEEEILTPSEVEMLRNLALAVGSRLEQTIDGQGASLDLSSEHHILLDCKGQNQECHLESKEDNQNAPCEGVFRRVWKPIIPYNDDLISYILRDSDPFALQRVLLAMVT